MSDLTRCVPISLHLVAHKRYASQLLSSTIAVASTRFRLPHPLVILPELLVAMLLWQPIGPLCKFC